MIYIVIGTKAQLIKMAPVMKEFKRQGVKYRFISTGQHRETMDDILDNFGLPGPDYRLYEGADIKSIPSMIIWAFQISYKAITKRNIIFGQHAEGIVLVHGDTFSTLLGAVIGRLAGLKIGHIESGLRSFNIFHPFPEELIRLATFRLSTILFCPGDWAVSNVYNYRAEKVNTGGNTLADALTFALSSPIRTNINIPRDPFAIVTLHRFENIFSRSALERILNIVQGIARQKNLLFILHPPTEKKLKEFGLFERLERTEGIEIRPRYDYFDFNKLLQAADFLVSDGGSNQEECYYLGKPILLLRKATERVEGLGENCVLSRYDHEMINSFLENWSDYKRPPHRLDFGASETIVNRCRKYW